MMARKKRTEKPKPAPLNALKEKPEQIEHTKLFLDPHKIELASIVSQKATINDIALVALSTNRADSVGDAPFKIEIVLKSNGFGIDKEQNRLTVRPVLSVSAFKQAADTSQSEPVISIQATFGLLYDCESLAEVPPENLAAFANTNAIFNLWPFWRELVLSISTRMRATPIIIPLLRV